MPLAHWYDIGRDGGNLSLAIFARSSLGSKPPVIPIRSRIWGATRSSLQATALALAQALVQTEFETAGQG